MWNLVASAPNEAHAGDRETGEIGVTSEMIEAGYREWLDWSEAADYRVESLVERIYLAMRRVRHKDYPDPSPVSRR